MPTLTRTPASEKNHGTQNGQGKRRREQSSSLLERSRANTPALSRSSQAVDPSHYSSLACQTALQQAYGPIQARASSANGASASESVPPADQESSQPLSQNVRDRMESAFGHRFSDVRIYQGASAPSIGALAYTQGRDIHFAPGQFNPSTQSGLSLLGHELTHVVQQRAGQVKIPQGKQGVGSLINADPTLESEADQLGARAARGERVQVRGATSRSQQAVQLQPEPALDGVIQCQHMVTVPIALRGGQAEFRQDDSVQITLNPQNHRLNMRFDLDSFPHIDEDALDDYSHLPDPATDAALLNLANRTTGAVVPGDKLPDTSPIERYYFTPGLGGVSMVVKGGQHHLMAANSAGGDLSQLLTGNRQHQIPEGDPRHIGTHVPKNLGFTHRHVLKIPGGRLTETEIQETHRIMSQYKSRPPRPYKSKSSRYIDDNNDKQLPRSNTDYQGK